jgi:hypothetical protein
MKEEVEEDTVGRQGPNTDGRGSTRPMPNYRLARRHTLVRRCQMPMVTTFYAQRCAVSTRKIRAACNHSFDTAASRV